MLLYQTSTTMKSSYGNPGFPLLAYAYGNMHVGLHDIIQPRGSVSNPGRCQFYFVRPPNTVRTTLYYACDQTDTQVEVCSRRCSHESLFIERESSVATLLLEIRALCGNFLIVHTDIIRCSYQRQCRSLFY